MIKEITNVRRINYFNYMQRCCYNISSLDDSKMSTHGLIFMTALLPTVGHQHIISFAANFVDYVHVIISTRSKEPTTFWQRKIALTEESNVFFYNHADDNAPQNPVAVDDAEFWGYWAKVVKGLVPDNIDYVFASEPYGMQVARSLNAEFIPVDTAREVQPVRGTQVRQNLFMLQDDIAQGFKEYLKLNVVLFGPESCGKTTMAKRLAKHFNGTFVPEWARPYLEAVGATITEYKMEMIVNGQYASERAAETIDTLIKFKDSDLRTTKGFYLYNGITQPDNLQWMIDQYPNDVYIIMNDKIPFTPDPLRYGGDKRETTKQFWIDLLESENRSYYVVESTDHEEQFQEICTFILNYELNSSGLTYNKLISFLRE